MSELVNPDQELAKPSAAARRFANLVIDYLKTRDGWRQTEQEISDGHAEIVRLLERLEASHDQRAAQAARAGGDERAIDELVGELSAEDMAEARDIIVDYLASQRPANDRRLMGRQAVMAAFAAPEDVLTAETLRHYHGDDPELRAAAITNYNVLRGQNYIESLPPGALHENLAVTRQTLAALKAELVRIAAAIDRYTFLTSTGQEAGAPPVEEYKRQAKLLAGLRPYHEAEQALLHRIRQLEA